MNGVIYKTINNINNKIYIGQHNTSANDGYLGSGVILQKAVKKYNRKNFKRTILENNITTQKLLDEREIYWIDCLSATDTSIGYNISKGGFGGGGISPSNETKLKISNSLKGKHLTEKTKNKISKSLIGRKNPRSISVTIKGITYESKRQCMLLTDLTEYMINKLSNQTTH